MVELCTHLAIERARLVTPHLKLARPISIPTQNEMEVKRGCAPVDGLRIYYEIHGTASPTHPPLVLLHGGGDTIETSFGHVLPEFTRDRQVIAFEQQGYGHTADILDRPFSPTPIT